MYEKLEAHLAPIVGAAGVQALLTRSAKLTQREFACFAELAVIESSAKLRECLRKQDPSVVAEAAVALFGTFFALITTFIGDRLTTEVLRSAWPTMDEPVSTENKK